MSPEQLEEIRDILLHDHCPTYKARKAGWHQVTVSVIQGRVPAIRSWDTGLIIWSGSNIGGAMQLKPVLHLKNGESIELIDGNWMTVRQANV